MRLFPLSWKSLTLAIQFLTRIPLARPVSMEDSVMRASLVWFPLVGLVLGGILYGVFYLAAQVFSPSVTGAVLVAVSFLVTGGLHLDGFMDTMDALFSGRERAKKLEIMRDSRVGAMGVAGGCILLLLKYSIYISLTPVTALPVLLLVPVASRWSLLWAIVDYPSARSDGLGRLFQSAGSRKALGGGSLVAVVILYAAGRWPALAMLAVAWAFAHLWARLMTRTLGGLTGDTYGALVEIGEAILALAVLGFAG